MKYKITKAILAIVSILIAIPPEAIAQNATCAKLEGQLRALNNASSGTGNKRTRQYENAIQNQEIELQRTQNYAQSLGCNDKFLIFEGGPAACRGLKSQISQMQSTLNQLYSQMERVSNGSSSVAGQREQIVESLQYYSCPGYVQPARQQRQQQVNPQQQSQQPPQPQRQQGQSFFGWLFGGQEEAPNQPQYSPNPNDPTLDPNYDPTNPFIGSGYRTVCVRKCDGFFFPISFSTSSANFERDEQTCRAQCPGADSALYAYHNPGQDIRDAFSINGESYTSLPNASKYRDGFTSDCSCKNGFSNWKEALANAQNELGNKSGDVLVSDKKAEELSMPKALRNQTTMKMTNPDGTKVVPTPSKDEIQKEATLADGSKKTIRQVGPTFLPAQ